MSQSPWEEEALHLHWPHTSVVALGCPFYAPIISNYTRELQYFFLLLSPLNCSFETTVLNANFLNIWDSVTYMYIVELVIRNSDCCSNEKPHITAPVIREYLSFSLLITNNNNNVHWLSYCNIVSIPLCTFYKWLHFTFYLLCVLGIIL